MTVGIAGKIGEARRPSAVQPFRLARCIDAEAFQIAVFQGDESAAAGSGSEGQLDLGQQIRIGTQTAC